MKARIFYFGIFIFFQACKPTFQPIQNVDSSARHFEIADFDLYTFTLVLEREDCDMPSQKHLKFSQKTELEEGDLVYEELYLLLEKEGNTVLYLTTFSHKYIYEGGVFNNLHSKTSVSINEADFLFIGTKEKEAVVFKNPKHEDLCEMQLNFSQENDTLLLRQITNNYPLKKKNPNKFIEMDSVFAVDIKFIKDERSFTYNDGCKNLPVKSLIQDSEDLAFELDIKGDYRFRRLKNRIGNRP